MFPIFASAKTTITFSGCTLDAETTVFGPETSSSSESVLYGKYERSEVHTFVNKSGNCNRRSARAVSATWRTSHKIIHGNGSIQLLELLGNLYGVKTAASESRGRLVGVVYLCTTACADNCYVPQKKK